MFLIPDGGGSREAYVHRLFSSIAYRYDLMNTTLSFNRDKYWRKFVVSRCNLQSGGRCLDVCCGTGMLSLLMAKAVGSEGEVVGIDFCKNMLIRADENIKQSPSEGKIRLVHGNALNLPFEDNSFDCATIGFGLRNVSDIIKTLEEMVRVVRPGGKVVSLDLSKPSAPVFKQVYYFYFNWIVPLLGRMGIGLSGPYSYLPESLKNFPHQSQIARLFSSTGLVNVCYHELTGGIVTVHEGIVRENPTII